MATSSQFEDCFNQSIRKQLCLNDDNEKDQQPNMPAHSKLLDVEIDLKAMLNNVVKIFCTEIPCSFHMPWQMKRQLNRTASGFVIENRWILSNAHAVANQSMIRIRKQSDPKKYPGRILYIAHECDLVIMTVDDHQFWDGVDPLILSDTIPSLQTEVTAVGYPIGGDNLSVTRGVVSRVCMSTYLHSLDYLLTIQIDAAINPGNSGGPAIQDKQVVGMLFQILSEAESISYVIPVSVIKHVLNDIERHKEYTAFPRMPFKFQFMENLSYRKYLQLNDDQHGILVTAIAPACALSKILQEDDVITAIDGVSIADDGTIDFRRGERLPFRYLEKLKFVGDEIQYKIIRKGEEILITSLLENIPPPVPLHSHDKRPEYLIYAGVVFTVLTRFYLYTWDKHNWEQLAPIELVSLVCADNLQELDQQIVIINQILADDINYGIDPGVRNTILKSVNGTQIHNLKHLAELIDRISNNETDAFIRFETESKRFIVVSCEDAKQSESRILMQNSIAHARSENLR